VIGLGSIGRRVAELAAAFGGRVIGVRRGAGSDAGEIPGVEVAPAARLPDVLAQSDFIVLALPLTPGTEEMFNGDLLSGAKPGAWLINVARGRLIDDKALIRALRENRIGGDPIDCNRLRVTVIVRQVGTDHDQRLRPPP